MATMATKKTTAAKSKASAEPAKPKSEKKPKAEVKTDGSNVTNVQVRVTKEKKPSQGLKIYKVSTPLKNDESVLHKLNSIQKAKNWINRIMGRKK